jgi:hypothetical protein
MLISSNELGRANDQSLYKKHQYFGRVHNSV